MRSITIVVNLPSELEGPFDATPVQEEILLALRAKDMRSDELARVCKCEKNRIFEKGRAASTSFKRPA